jgi:hypothetical protein
MRLAQLDPRFFVLETGGPAVGLTFECPHCFDPAKGFSGTRLAVFFHERGREAIEDQYIAARHPGGPSCIWTVEGPEDFAVLTLMPSIDASHAGHWHGFVKNGEIT